MRRASFVALTAWCFAPVFSGVTRWRGRLWGFVYMLWIVVQFYVTLCNYDGWPSCFMHRYVTSQVSIWTMRKCCVEECCIVRSFFTLCPHGWMREAYKRQFVNCMSWCTRAELSICSIQSFPAREKHIVAWWWQWCTLLSWRPIGTCATTFFSEWVGARVVDQRWPHSDLRGVWGYAKCFGHVVLLPWCWFNWVREHARRLNDRRILIAGSGVVHSPVNTNLVQEGQITLHVIANAYVLT